jgi:hypothetical protein
MLHAYQTCVQFTNAEIVYVKSYYVLYHVLSFVVSYYYHLYIMLHAYQKLRNKSVQF